jgi:N,N-dimethylformamidase
MSSKSAAPRVAFGLGRPSPASIFKPSMADMAACGGAMAGRRKSFAGSDSRRKACSKALIIAAWIFEGIDDAILGDFGLSGGGAAGFELDRADFELGTPPDALILARSEAHQSHHVVVPEELLNC